MSMRTLNHLIRWRNRLCARQSCGRVYKFDELLSLVKEYIIDVWEKRKHKLYDSDSGPVNNSILGLHLGKAMISPIRMVSLFRMV